MNKHLAFVFPGQGSQSVGMLKALDEHYPSVKHTFAEASQILNYDLWKIIQDNPNNLLNQTEYTQPALLVSEIAIWRVWRECNGVMPAIMAGHSLGEYTALICAEALTFSDAVKLVANRGTFMQAAVPEGKGAMAAIVGLSDEQIAEICKESAGDEIVSPANYNTIGQVVIAGNTDAVERAIIAAEKAGAKLAKKLAVSVPSHCLLMQPAAALLSVELNETHIYPPVIPVINNVDATVNTQSDAIKFALTKQLYSPVRWVETIQVMQEKGIQQIIECGPGKVLSGLIKRINSELKIYSIYDPDTLSSTLKNVMQIEEGNMS